MWQCATRGVNLGPLKLGKTISYAKMALKYMCSALSRTKLSRVDITGDVRPSLSIAHSLPPNLSVQRLSTIDRFLAFIAFSIRLLSDDFSGKISVDANMYALCVMHLLLGLSSHCAILSAYAY